MAGTPLSTKVCFDQSYSVKESGRLGATLLIPKVEAVPDVTELRPITLLQVDYRLLSKCLAVRLHMVMEEVVDPGQLGTGGRNILTGVYNIICSIDYVNQQDLAAFLASWNARKAYDRSLSGQGNQENGFPCGVQRLAKDAPHGCHHKAPIFRPKQGDSGIFLLSPGRLYSW